VKLSPQEIEFVKGMCNIYKDSQLAGELTRIRFDMGIRDHVTIDQVRKARYKLGIAKKQGRGKCQTIKKKEKE